VLPNGYDAGKSLSTCFVLNYDDSKTMGSYDMDTKYFGLPISIREDENTLLIYTDDVD